MSKIAKDLLVASGIKPKLRLFEKVGKSLRSTGKHIVKLVADKATTGTEFASGKEIEFVKFLFEENGEQKTYQVPKLGKDGELHYLVQRFAEIKEGTELVIWGEKKGMKNIVNISLTTSAGGAEVEEHESNSPDEPVIE